MILFVTDTILSLSLQAEAVMDNLALMTQPAFGHASVTEKYFSELYTTSSQL